MLWTHMMLLASTNLPFGLHSCFNNTGTNEECQSLQTKTTSSPYSSGNIVGASKTALANKANLFALSA